MTSQLLLPETLVADLVTGLRAALAKLPEVCDCDNSQEEPDTGAPVHDEEKCVLTLRDHLEACLAAYDRLQADLPRVEATVGATALIFPHVLITGAPFDLVKGTGKMGLQLNGEILLKHRSEVRGWADEKTALRLILEPADDIIQPHLPLFEPAPTRSLEPADVVQVTLDLLGRAGVTVDRAAVMAWTVQQRTQAQEWANATQANTSGQDWVTVPPRPDFLPPDAWTEAVNQIDFSEGAPPAEPPAEAPAEPSVDTPEAPAEPTSAEGADDGDLEGDLGEAGWTPGDEDDEDSPPWPLGT